MNTIHYSPGAGANALPTPLRSSSEKKRFTLKQKLTQNDLREVCKDLQKERADWFTLGIQLGIDFSVLEGIQKSAGVPSPVANLSEGLRLWMEDDNEQHTWALVACAVRDLSNARLASQIETVHQHDLTKELNEDDLPALEKVLYEMAPKWHALCQDLGVDYHALQEVKDAKSPEDLLRETLNVRLNKGDFTYENIIDALKAKGHNSLAASILSDRIR